MIKWKKNKIDFKKLILLIIIAIVAYWTISNFTTIGNLFSNVFGIIFPFVLGGALAFILNIPMSFFENKILKINGKKNNKNKKVKYKKLKRIVSILFAIAVIALVLTIIINLILPELIKVINLLISNIPYYLEETTKLIQNYGENIPDLNKLMQEANIDLNSIRNQLIGQIPNLLTSSISIVTGIFSGITTFIIAIIFAIYILMEKENLQVQTSKVIYAYLNKEKADAVMNVGKVSNNTFKRFFTVQCLEASILGTLCIIGMWILKIPYAVPIGVLIGVTALIPIVGAFIGVIIGSVLIVSIAPIKVITFVLFVFILQQIEGNLIYPRVVGNSVGLPGMWVLFAVSVGGSLGGIIGMLLGVPVATIMYTLLRNDVDKRLEQKKELMNENVK